MVAGCQTVPRPEPIHLPASLQDHFASCKQGDGALGLSVKSPESPTQMMRLEWIGNPGGWKAEGATPLGQTLVRLEYDRSDDLILRSGMIEQKLPPLTVEDGDLLVDGHYVGLKPDEVSCFLAFNLPIDWLGQAYGYRQNDSEIRFNVAGERRRIEVVASQWKTPAKRELCARISWSQFLGMVSRNWRICMRGNKPKTAVVSGLDEYILRWEEDED